MAVGVARGRVAYADGLRVLAVIAVIVLHLSGGGVETLPPGDGAWMVCNLYNGLLRWCVPVFVMLSGMFLLDPAHNMGVKKLCGHLLRLVMALAVWGSGYAIFVLWLRGKPLNLPSISAALGGVLRGATHYHLWFLYMMLGLYLLTPILRAFVRGASRGDFHYFFLLYGVFLSLLPLVLRFRPSETVQRYLGLMYLTTSAFKYVGYYVAGYYLKTYALHPVAKLVVLLLGAAGGIVTVGGAAWLGQMGHNPQILYEYATPNVAAMAVAVFVLARSLPEGLFRGRFWGTAARVSLGIYLVHEVFLQLLRRAGVGVLSFAPVASIPLLTVAVFAASFAVAWLLGKLPVVGRILV